MASYPGGVFTAPTRAAGQVIQPGHMTSVQEELTAIETGLLSGFSHPLGLANYATAAFPSPSAAGRIVRRTDGVRGLWLDTATQWVSLGYDEVNVKEFGAVGDSGTDDAAAIQDAIDALPAIGGVVVVPPGIYLIETPLILNSDRIIIRGAGWNASRFMLKDGVDDSMFKIGDAATFVPSWIITGLFLGGNSTNNATGHGILVNGTEWGLVTRCHIHDFKQCGIKVTSDGTPNEIYLELSSNRIDTNLGNGIDIGANCYGVRVLDNIIGGNGKSPAGGWGVLAQSGDNHQIRGNQFDENENGVGLAGIADSIIAGNNFQQTDRTSIVTNSSCRTLVITGNTILNSSVETADTYSAIILDGTTYSAVTGNTIYGAAVRALHGIVEGGAADYNTIVGNTIRHTQNGVTVVGANTYAPAGSNPYNASL